LYNYGWSKSGLLKEYCHRAIYDEWLEMNVVFDLNQMFNEITWERLHNNELRSSILDQVYTNNLESIKEVIVEKQKVIDHSLICKKTEGQLVTKKFQTMNYQNWKKYSKENLLMIIQQKKVNALSQQICDMLDKML